MLKKITCLIALCLSVKAQTDNAVESPSTANSEKVKVSPRNVSDLYIGDLLRTKPKEVMEAAGSVHQPVIASRNYVSPVHASASPAVGRTLNHKSHGGHEYVATEYSRPEFRSSIPSSTASFGSSPRVVPLLGHLLTVKPVRVVAGDALPLARHSGSHQRTGHSPHDDCSKNGDHSYSSEERSYAPEEKTYRRAKHTAPDTKAEYRNPQGAYDEDDSSDRYSSHSDPSSGSYNSKTLPSDTRSKSHSSGSYTTSKSTSTSRTVIPSKSRSKQKARITPTSASHLADYDKGGASGYENQGVVVYRVREPKQRPHSNNAGQEYSPGGEHSSGGSESPYSQYPEENGRPRKQPPKGKAYYSNDGKVPVQDRPRQNRPSEYAPSAVDHERDNYEQNSYSPSAEHRHREQSNPGDSYHRNPDHTYRPDVRGQDQPRGHSKSYDNPDNVHQYKTESIRPMPITRQKNLHYETSDERQSPRYRSKQVSSPGYDYNTEQPIQSSRLRNSKPYGSYDSYSQQESSTESVQSPQPYEGNHPDLRPSEEKQMNQYIYESTPHQVEGKHSPRSHRNQYRESPRFIRSPTKYAKLVRVDEMSQLPSGRNEPLIMVSKESKPYVSHSVSYSNSGYTLDDKAKPEPKVQYRNNKEGSQRQENPPTEGRQSSGFDQTVYKPYNSEYPASYANDPHVGSPMKYQPESYQQRQPYEHPQPYDRNPSKYRPSQERQPYEHNGPQDDSNEDYDAPAKPNKDHQYVSKVEGYRDEYSSSLPLHLDDAFFEKYGISKNAKIIVAKAVKPHLLVADGANIEAGGYTEGEGGYLNEGGYSNEGGHSEGAPGYSSEGGHPERAPGYSNEGGHSDRGPGYSNEGGHSDKGPGYSNEGGHSDKGPGYSEPIDEERFEPNFKEDYPEDSKEDSYNESPEQLGAPKEVPGSFDDLVNTDPSFLRNLPKIMTPVDTFFKHEESSDGSFNEDQFRSFEQKGFVVSQGPREIVQQHGDGVSRIIFNVAKGEGRTASSTNQDGNRRADDEKVLEAAASAIIENIIKSDS